MNAHRLSFKLLLVLVALGCLAAGGTSAQPSVGFAPRVDYATALGPYDAAAGDLNGDGWPDLALPASGSDMVSVLLNRGDGTFLPRVDYPTPSSPGWITFADFNNDLKLDLAITSWTGLISIFLGNGDGTLGARTDFSSGASNTSVIRARDLNGDGKQDLAAGYHFTSSVGVFLGNGDGTIGAPAFFGTGSGPDHLELGDLNADGKLDLVTSNRWANTASVLLGNGDGTFGTAATYTAGTWPWGVCMGDFDEDGKLDVVITNHHPTPTFSLLRGNGDGTLAPAITVPVPGGGLDRGVMGDLNMDGHLDLATPNNPNTIAVLLGRGNASFYPATTFVTGMGAARACVADVNRDGRPDLVVGNYNDNSVSVLRNTSGTDITPQPPGVCISTAHPCVEVPVTIAREEFFTSMRGYSITLQLSANLAVCSPGIEEGNYLGSIGGTNFQVIDNGGGSYTVDCAILGLPCGATALTGTLFALHLGSAAPAGVGTVTVTGVILRDCANAPMPGYAGLPAAITIDNTLPAAPTGLTATQVRTGNDSDGTTQITVAYTPPPDAVQVEVYRAGYGNYPEYDDPPGAGSVPAPPASYPPAAPWVMTSVTMSGQTDEVGDRDVWYYVAYAIDACDNVSLVSNRTNGTLNYHLGDVSTGLARCAGENLVNTADLSLLGAHYGATLAVSDTSACLDVGPTLDFSVHTRPTTDNKVGFEDLMMFAINHAQVSKPGWNLLSSESTGPNALSLEIPLLPNPGAEFVATVKMTGAGNIQGLSLDLDYDATVITPVGVSAGELMDRQAQPGIVLTTGGGTVDAALLGSGAGIAGSGELAHVTLRVLAAGDPALSLARAVARDSENRPVDVTLQTGGVSESRVPLRTSLGNIYPNPFTASATIPIELQTSGWTDLAVFDVSGRLVRTILSGEASAGVKTTLWDGRDDRGRPVGSGLYVIRLRAGGDRFSRPVYVVR